MGSSIPELVDSTTTSIFCKKLKYGIEPKFYKDRIRPTFFFAFKKNTTTGTNANFLSTEPNGQGYILKKKHYMQGLKCAILEIFQKSADWLNWPCPVSAALKKPSVE